MWKCSLPPNSVFAGSDHPSPTDSMQRSLFSFLTVCKTRHLSPILFHLSRKSTQVFKVGLLPPEQQGHRKDDHKCIQIVSVENDLQSDYTHSGMMKGGTSRAGAKGKYQMSVVFVPLPRWQQWFVGSHTLQARTLQARHLVGGSIVCPGHVPFGTLPSVSLLFQINTVLCLVSQLMQPTLKQGLTLGYSEQIITFPCAVRQMPYFTQRWRFFLGMKTYHPGFHLHKQKILLLWKAEEMKAGNEGRQKNKDRKLVSWRGGVWMV